MFDQSERYFDQDDDKPDLPKEWITKNPDFLPTKRQKFRGRTAKGRILYYRDFTIEVQ